MGKKGEITHILRGLKDVSLEERPKIGSYANQVRDKVSNLISDKTNTIKKSDLNKKLLKETIDFIMDIYMLFKKLSMKLKKYS